MVAGGGWQRTRANRRAGVKALLALLGAPALLLAPLAVLVVLGSSPQSGACSLSSGIGQGAAQSGAWVATAYGPPWGGIEGDGITATGLNLTAGPPAFEVAVDPKVIALGSYVHVQPNPFATSSAFYAGDTGGAITGKHIDIYDWQGRASQNAWGQRPVTVTPAPNPGAGNLLGAVPAPPSEHATTSACQSPLLNGSLGLTAGQTARIGPDGTATAPQEAPTAVKLAIAAGNLIHTRTYPEPDQHYGTLVKLWPAYDCSGATSFVLYAAGLNGPNALDSTGLESYGQPGPGRWITIYANSAHAWIVIAGIALDTANYGGPPIPAGSGPRWRTEPLANLNDGSTYTARHPPGL
jgi:3D (Asp-Asp-Asp) domain-containing protein